jgi:methylated-DNA-protein-cysteine methyltransferase-like protein
MMDFSQRVKEIIKSIPKGAVATYGQIARMAGFPRGARQVAYILHSCSGKHDLPWHRIVNRKGRISLARGYGYELQYKLLSTEGIEFDSTEAIDLGKYGWKD